MISVSEAKAIITKNITVLQPKEMPLIEASGHVLAHDVFASIDIPPFEQSSMDGYAIRFADKDSHLFLRGEMAAGTTQKIIIQPGETARIFTGAPLPEGTDTVIMQEKVSVQNGSILADDAQLKQGSNVRKKGAEIKAGSLAMQQDSFLSPAAIGFLAGIGISKVYVYPTASVSIIVTGNELQSPGKALLTGQVYESNSFLLRAALKQADIQNINNRNVL